MNEARLASLKNNLLQEKDRLERELKGIDHGNLALSQAETSGERSYEDSPADTGTITFERERDLSLELNVQDMLDRVNIALARIEKGTYGTCANCGKNIPAERLKALPYADLCIDCKALEEKAP